MKSRMIKSTIIRLSEPIIPKLNISNKVEINLETPVDLRLVRELIIIINRTHLCNSMPLNSLIAQVIRLKLKSGNYHQIWI